MRTVEQTVKGVREPTPFRKFRFLGFTLWVSPRIPARLGWRSRRWWFYTRWYKDDGWVFALVGYFFAVSKK